VVVEARITMESQLIHHSALSFYRLRAMKIKDRSSCHVIILDSNLATPETLSSDNLFSRFGEISSIRILRDTNPREAHIRFERESSAAAAIAWCNSASRLFVNAKYGYQKYCVRFINHQKCDVSGCAMRHSWCDMGDILNFDSLFESAVTPLVSVMDAAQIRENRKISSLQDQILSLRNNYGIQSQLADDLMAKINRVYQENVRLQQQLQEVRGQKMWPAAQFQPDSDWTDDEQDVVDGLRSLNAAEYSNIGK